MNIQKKMEKEMEKRQKEWMLEKKKMEQEQKRMERIKANMKESKKAVHRQIKQDEFLSFLQVQSKMEEEEGPKQPN